MSRQITLIAALVLFLATGVAVAQPQRVEAEVNRSTAATPADQRALDRDATNSRPVLMTPRNSELVCD